MTKKFLFGAVAAASILGASAIAHAGYYIPTCSWYLNAYGYWVQVCG